MATSLDQSDFMKTALRLPRGMHARLLAAADAHGTSLNSFILLLLERGLERPLVGLDEQALDDIRAIFEGARHK
mgnify:CR=1 FL=1